MGKVIGYAPGVFDLFHIGHLNILKQAKLRCDFLVAGVVSDKVCLARKGAEPCIPLVERVEILQHIDLVDQVHVELTGDKRDAWEVVRFDRIFKGDDWRGTAAGSALELQMAEVGAEVVYFPYTETTSSSALRRVVELVGAGL
jgi:glycerol-3-phosphate cytidylyltransferase